jgi:antitoxin (DNA-binding transcriptional repressor) of toxin-antitoxin stability system
VLNWVSKGEEVEVTRRGKTVARVVPVAAALPAKVDWANSAALKGMAWAKALTHDESRTVLADSQGS